MNLRQVTAAATRRLIPTLILLTTVSSPALLQAQNAVTIPLAPHGKVIPVPYNVPAPQVGPSAGASVPGTNLLVEVAEKSKSGASGTRSKTVAKAPAKKAAASAPAKKVAAAPAKKAAKGSAAKPSVAAMPKPKSPLQANMMQAFAAANKGDWSAARTFAAATGNTTFNTLLQWRYLVESGTAASFEEINSFLTAYPNWPRRDALVAAAEKTMPVEDPRQVIAWYGTQTPQTARGKIRLGEALMATGEQDRGVALIRKAWIEGNFGPTDEYQILATHYLLLTAEDQRARLDVLLARDDIVAAKRQMPRADAEAQSLADARIQIKANSAAAAAVLARLPESQRGNPELLFDAARAQRRLGDDNAAWTTLAQARGGKSLVLPDERWGERHIMTRDALKAGKYDVAYGLVSQHGMQAGSGFADAEFLAGWIALRYLHQPQNALPHFEALAKAVSLPISKARAYYWLGRTEEDLERPVRAIADYREAALHRETFYGQLALARIDDDPVLVLQPVSATNIRAEQAGFEADLRVAAIRLLADLSDRERMRLFAIRVANDTPQPGRLQMLAELMVSLGDPAMGVRVAKLASYNGVVLASNLAPTVALPRFPGAGDAPEPALVLGLTRQESEFDPKAVSSAGARGLMQLMPATAKRAAQQNQMTYKLNDLTTKPQYNMQLGMATIAEYLDKWGGSYILGIASYNAGAGNVTRWIEANGDPRDPTVDPIDWIERIPFSETRNYVQRVLENLGIYHNRLGGNGKLTILADLHRPNLPRVIALKDQPSAMPVSVEHPVPVVNSPATGQPVAVP